MSEKPGIWKEHKSWIVLALIIVTLWAGSGILVHLVSGTNHRGTFGDMFGAINALFSGLALAGIIVAIFLQRRDLDIQKDELKATRHEFEQQTFENTLFRMLQLHMDAVNAMEIYPSGTGVIRGRIVLRQYYKGLLDGIGSETANVMRRKYRERYDQYRYHLSHYYRSLHAILKSISAFKGGTDEDRELYIAAVRAQFSDYELGLLALHCICSDEAEDLFRLVYGLGLMHKAPTELGIRQEHKELFDAGPRPSLPK